MSQKIKERPDGSLRVQTVNKLPDMTKQSFKDDCDINLIIDRYDNSGIVTHLNHVEAQYGDVTQLQDYQQALDTIHAVEDYFNALPAQTRAVFENSPATFLDYANDPDKREKLAELGLIEGPTPSDSAPATPPASVGGATGGADPDPAPGGTGSSEPSS